MSYDMHAAAKQFNFGGSEAPYIAFDHLSHTFAMTSKPLKVTSM